MIKFPDHIKDSHGYLFFSANTQGQSGNPVKIHADLFIDFFCNVDPSTHDGQAVIREIESLRAFGKLAGTPAQAPRKVVGSDRHKNILEKLYKTQDHMRSYQSLARERTVTSKSVKVSFQIDQKAGDKFPTVYISHVKILPKIASNAGGLYEYKGTVTGQGLLKTNNSELNNQEVIISKGAEDVQTALDTTETETQAKLPKIFFNPIGIARELTSTNQKNTSQDALNLVNDLTALIQKNSNKTVAWHVEGEGAALLAQAIPMVSGNLANHSFRFVNARTNLPKLLENLSKRKALLPGEFINYTNNHAALVSIAQHSSELKETLKNLPSSSGYDQITRRYLGEYLNALGNISSAKNVVSLPSQIRGSSATFVDVLTNAHKGRK